MNLVRDFVDEDSPELVSIPLVPRVSGPKQMVFAQLNHPLVKELSTLSITKNLLPSWIGYQATTFRWALALRLLYHGGASLIRLDAISDMSRVWAVFIFPPVPPGIICRLGGATKLAPAPATAIP